MDSGHTACGKTTDTESVIQDDSFNSIEEDISDLDLLEDELNFDELDSLDEELNFDI